MYNYDNRIVMTLDAGGTNFIFSAIQSNQQIVEPIRLPACAHDLDLCLGALIEGFNKVKEQLPQEPTAISFAFPGPADYPNGIIGDLPNFPSFRGGIALGPMLESKFGIPVYINNDGDLFAYGEAVAGILPQINARLEARGSNKRFKNLLGVTLGTGFGAGVVVNKQLLIGDNSDGGNVWNNRNPKYPDMIIEESVSIRAVQRVYRELSGEDKTLTPKDIFDIAQGVSEGNQSAAQRSFAELGEMAAEAIAHATNLIDGLVVIGGGLAGAHKYILPSMIERMNSKLKTFAGDALPRMSIETVNLEDNFQALLEGEQLKIKVPMTDKTIDYKPRKITGVAISELGASEAIALGAYAFALSEIDNE